MMTVIKDDNWMFYNAGDPDLCSAQLSHFLLTRHHLDLISTLWGLPLFDGDTNREYVVMVALHSRWSTKD